MADQIEIIDLGYDLTWQGHRWVFQIGETQVQVYQADIDKWFWLRVSCPSCEFTQRQHNVNRRCKGWLESQVVAFETMRESA